MKISVMTGHYAHRYGDAEALRRLAAAGYEAVDFSMFPYKFTDFPFTCTDQELRDFYAPLKEVAKEVGIAFGQMHSSSGPYPATEEEREIYYHKVRRALIVCDTLEIPYLVVHPLARHEEYVDAIHHEECKKENVDFFARFIPTLEQTGIKMAIENLIFDPKPEVNILSCCSHSHVLAEYIDTLNEMAGKELFVACLDTGHGSLTPGEDVPHMIRTLGRRLQVLHVHDTDRKTDLHTLPYFSIGLDWPAVCAALKDIGYAGTFNLETDPYAEAFPEHLLPLAYAYQYDVAKTLVSWIEG